MIQKANDEEFMLSFPLSLFYFFLLCNLYKIDVTYVQYYKTNTNLHLNFRKNISNLKKINKSTKALRELCCGFLHYFYCISFYTKTETLNKLITHSNDLTIRRQFLLTSTKTKNIHIHFE